jgi:hypothetical protein
MQMVLPEARFYCRAALTAANIMSVARALERDIPATAS